METQLIKDGQINSDTINKQELLAICAEMIKESRDLGVMSDKQQSQFIQKYSTFSTEYPSVFNMIMNDKQFYTAPFLKYLEFKLKQPLVYTNTEQCVKDLCFYPIQVFKYLNNHYNERQYRDFKTQLYNKMTEHHNAQKEQLKEMTQKIVEQQQNIKQNLVDQILKLAVKQQLMTPY